jgi:hypothetical protein
MYQVSKKGDLYQVRSPMKVTVDGHLQGLLDSKKVMEGSSILFSSRSLFVIFDANSGRILELAGSQNVSEIINDLILDFAGYGFPTSDIKVLVTSEATPEKIEDLLRNGVGCVPHESFVEYNLAEIGGI